LPAAVLMLVLAPSAKAALLAPFNTTITVDTQYVNGANGATDIAFSADGRAIVTRKSGQVVVRRADGTLNVVPYPFGGTLDTSSEKGLLGVVADPNVASNFTFYFYVSNGPDNDKHRVYRAVLTATDSLTVDMTPVVAASRGVGPGLEGPANHDGGGLFIYNNMLYVSVGDTGANNTPPDNKYSSCLNKGNGKILRVDLQGAVPSDNPLVALTSVTACDSVNGPWISAAPDKRIYAWGFRNPWRFWVDAQTGLLWIGDVGEVTREEISVGSMDQHYGYPFEEGDQVWGNVAGMNCTGMTPSRPCTPPVYAYPTISGGSVTGGLILEGCGWANVFSGPHYIFGDAGPSFIRALPVNAARDGVSSTMPLDVGNYGTDRPVSFRMGPDGSLYIVFYGAGAVYRFTPNDRTGAGCGGTGTGGSGGVVGMGGGAAIGGSGGQTAGGAGGSGGRSSGGGTTSVGGANTGGSATGGSGAASSSDKGSCGCRLARGGAGAILHLLPLSVGALALGLRRRRGALLKS
jgi:glucose/arabinose dehydrogenase